MTTKKTVQPEPQPQIETPQPQPLLILHDNGEIVTPGATKLGEVYQRCRLVGQAAEQMQQQWLDTPLPQRQPKADA